MFHAAAHGLGGHPESAAQLPVDQRPTSACDDATHNGCSAPSARNGARYDTVLLHDNHLTVLLVGPAAIVMAKSLQLHARFLGCLLLEPIRAMFAMLCLLRGQHLPMGLVQLDPCCM